MKPDLLLSLEGSWYHFNGTNWQVTSDQPVLAGPCRLLTDFGGSPAGVLTVDTKPEFAPAMIEKKIRSEGLVDGESHILTHRLIYAGGSSRVFYTAVPVSSWNAMFTWLDGESSIALVYSIEASMLALSRRFGAVMCRAGRQFRFLVSQPDKLIHVTTTAFSDDPDDLDIALTALIDRVGQKTLANGEVPSVYWCDLLASDRDDGARLINQFSQRMGVKVLSAPVNRFDTPAGPLRTAAGSMIGPISWRAATNPWNERIAAAIDQFSKPIAGAVALIGLGLFSVATAWTSQSMGIQASADRTNQQATEISQRISGQDIPPAKLLAAHAPSIAFLDNLNQAASSPDPLAVLNDVRRAADKRVRVMRIQLVSRDGMFRVDGTPVEGVDTDAALSGFLAGLKFSGYKVSAVDPGNQSQLPGFFSYSLQQEKTRDGARQ